MIKEFALAIILGILLGFGITGGYIATQKGKKGSIPIPTPIAGVDISPSPTEDPENLSTTTDEIMTTKDSLLVIQSPKDEEIVNRSLLEINGKTEPNNIVIIVTTQSQYQTLASETGEFSQEIELESGPNNIQISAFNSEEIQTSVNLQITYSTAKI